MKVVIPEIYGFCRGVRGAIEKAERALVEASEKEVPCYFYGDIVHSRAVMENFLSKGAMRIGNPDEARAPGIVIIRAHGIPDKERSELVAKGLTIVDATCPVVLHSQLLLRTENHPLFVIGNSGHSEVVSLLGSCSSAILIERPSDLVKLRPGVDYHGVVQTTFSLTGLESILKSAEEMGISMHLLNSVCHASMERRAALSAISGSVDAIIVAGDSISRNTLELWKAAEATGKPSFLVPDANAIPGEVFSFDSVGLTAGASCPDILIEEIKRRLLDA